MKKRKKAWVIVGPTAGGKTGLGIRLAQKIGGEIINADSMQVYRDLSVITACPTEEEKNIVPHHLFQFVDAWTDFNVSKWGQAVREVFERVERPVFIGGTGLYIDCLIKGLSEMPTVPEEIRQFVRQIPDDELAHRLKDFPFPDPQRRRRALEILLATGKPISYFQQQPRKKFIEDVEFKVIFVNPPRPVLYQNCADRLKIMKQNGCVAEVEKLLSLNPTGTVLKAIGIPPIQQFLEGHLTESEMDKQILLDTRHYAKRQVTWFKNQLKQYVMVENPSDTLIDYLI